MLKLMKYEFRKQAFSKVILLILAGILELIFFTGILINKEQVIGFAVGFLVFYAFGALFFLSYEAIFTFYNDLKQKCSYMLFLTPNTSYKIVGAKVLSAGIQILIAGAALFILAAIDGATLIAKYSSLAQAKEMVLTAVKQMFQIDITLNSVIAFAVMLIASWVSTITVGFFSISLSTTFLANSKLNGFVSFAFFVILNIVFTYIVNKVVGPTVEVDNLFNMTRYYLLQGACEIIFTVITYTGTAWMLDKKVSV